MSWFSILPESLAFVEVWAMNTFFLLGMICIGPWLLLLVYDVGFYIFRLITYEIPYVGGRARNRPRPRAPSLNERPNGQGRPRILTMPSANGTVNVAEMIEETAEGMKKRMEQAGQPRKDSGAIIDD
ncbi:hypothetical protein sscle_13g096650 [Sclerotinia sclerotiorum 1980 UF-70]|uniref:Uncharacterized protein n=1 Tax=Sclerotinia sclerotiorum (strain ATCC 18683 / 1980 / Ss-1) TaxID=665079 RepID=A0A1D9QIX3_SCLS1|nr:hypothetical protein sscle_13g096650 [Sclerotinia sclerotiorum 1980 UF-70]